MSAARGTVAIIGHGKSPVGKRWGGRIDACDYVVRMWDCHWQDEPDYGTKYDYGLFEAYETGRKYWSANYKREPTRQWVASLWKVPRGRELPPNTLGIDPAKYSQIGMSMGGHGIMSSYLNLTRGTIATLWAIEQSEPGYLIILVGFDNVKCGVCLSKDEGFPQAYLDQPTTFTFDGYVAGRRRQCGHDFGIERALLEKVAKESQVELAFAEDVWGQCQAV